jgi:hypothetical protein
MNVLERYEGMSPKAPQEVYNTSAEADARARELGGSGFHSHTEEDGSIIYMPFSTHAQFEAAIGFEGDEFKTEMRNKIRMRLEQLLSATTTTNGF